MSCSPRRAQSGSAVIRERGRVVEVRIGAVVAFRREISKPAATGRVGSSQRTKTGPGIVATADAAAADGLLASSWKNVSPDVLPSGSAVDVGAQRRSEKRAATATT